jgi:hypothetical protein
MQWKLIPAAIALGASAMLAQPAAASPLMAATGAASLSAAVQPVETVQYRRWHGGPGYHRHGWHHRGYGTGAAVIGGLAAGAVIGGAIANSQARANDTVAYCAQRYRSYDPASGTYTGYDGNRHPCP